MQKTFKQKLLGKELAKAATPKALEEYSHSKILTYIDNVKNNDPATMKMLDEYDPNAVKYNSARGQFQKGNKFGALSDFKDDLKKDNEFNERFKQDKEKAYQELKTPTLYKSIFPLGKKKKLSDLDLIFSAADPIEKMRMRKDYKEYDFTQRQFKEDIKEVKKVEPQITFPAPIAPPPVPRKDVGEIIRERAAAREAREKKEYVKKYGNHGLGGLGFRREFGE